MTDDADPSLPSSSAQPPSVPPSAPPMAPPPPPGAPAPTLEPTSSKEREPILDVLRGFALFGILFVNIELMRGSNLFDVFLGREVTSVATTADQATSFLVGWLVSGKFISAFSMMFGLGAALIARRALDAGRSPRGLLARRYGWLIAFGLAHMLLLFPGDVLFVYGVTGMILLAFVRSAPRTMLRWSAGLIVGTTVLITALTALTLALEAAGPVDTGLGTLLDDAAAAYAGGSYLEVIRANAVVSLLVQGNQLTVLPWFLGLFLLGFAAGRSGLVQDLRAWQPRIRRAAIVGLGVGLPLNLVMGFTGPLGVEETSAGISLASTAVQQLGAPILTIGYLSTLVLFCLRRGPIRPLAATGRMALSAYLLQSVLALTVFWGFGLYDQLGPAEALVVVVGILIAVVAISTLWMRAFRFGPAEWLWRTLTYGRGQPLRAGGRGES